MAAEACTCGELSSPEDAQDYLEGSDAAFVGTAQSSTGLWTPGELEGSEFQTETEFRVDRLYFGVPQPSLQVRHETSGPACGVRYEPGKQYVILTWTWQTPKRTTTSCSSWPIENAPSVLMDALDAVSGHDGQ